LSNKIAGLMGFIEPILMAIIAVVIWGIVGAIFLPMASLVENLPSG
jgi:type II secretory pathway component PulF